MSQVKKPNKVVIIGDSAVGKTCIIERFIKNSFGETKTTIGAAHYNKTVNGCVLDIWDTAGQERFKSMIPMYYKGAKCIIICFDLNDPNTFEGAKNWLREIESNIKNTIIILVGNKCDLITNEKEKDLFKQYATQKGFIYTETSAKNNINITELFNSVADQVLKLPAESKDDNKVDISNSNTGSYSCSSYC